MPEYDYSPILLRLKDAKKRSGLTNEELSKLSGVPVGTLKKIFSGDTTEPKLPAFMSIASALHTSVDYLVYGVTRSNQKISDEQAELLSNYNKLNLEGRSILLNTSRGLVAGGQYETEQNVYAG